MAVLVLGVTGLLLTVAALMPRSVLDFMPRSAVSLAHLLAGPVVLLAVLLGLIGFRRSQRRVLLLGAILGCVAVALFVQEVPLRLRAVDRTSGFLWRLANPPTHEMVLELKPDAGFPLRVGDLAKTVEILSSRQHDLGRFYVLRPVPPDKIVIPLTARDESVYRRERLPQTMGYITFHLVHPNSDRIVAEASRPGVKCPEGYLLVRGSFDGVEEAYVVNKEPELRDSVQSAEALSQPGEPWSVELNFDNRGRKAFGDFTARHRGHRIAILLDGRVIAAPVIKEPIREGRASINCGGPREAVELTHVLQLGGIPCPIKLVEIRRADRP